MFKSSAGFFSVGIPKLTPDPNTVHILVTLYTLL